MLSIASSIAPTVMEYLVCGLNMSSGVCPTSALTSEVTTDTVCESEGHNPCPTIFESVTLYLSAFSAACQDTLTEVGSTSLTTISLGAPAKSEVMLNFSYIIYISLYIIHIFRMHYVQNGTGVGGPTCEAYKCVNHAVLY